MLKIIHLFYILKYLFNTKSHNFLILIINSYHLTGNEIETHAHTHTLKILLHT